MDAWITFWKWAYLIGLGSFLLLVVLLIPFGARDLMALFKHLQRNSQHPSEKDSQS